MFLPRKLHLFDLLDMSEKLLVGVVLLGRLDEVCNKITNSDEGFHDSNTAFITKTEWRQYKERSEEDHERISGVEYGLEYYSRKSYILDVKFVNKT